MQTWIIFSLLAALTWAIVNISDKYVISKLINRPMIPVLFMGILSIISAVVVYFVHGFEKMSWPLILMAGAAGVVYVAFAFCYFKAMQTEEVSRMVPLMYVNPLFILVISIFLFSEVLTVFKYLGVLLLVLGGILISTEDIHKFKLSKGAWIMLFGTFLLAVNQVLTKYLLNYADFWTVFAYVRIAAFIALIPIFAIEFNHVMHIIKQKDKKAFWLITLTETLNIVGILFITVAIAGGSATLANALSSVQPFIVLVFALLLSRFHPEIIKESLHKKTIILKIAAIIIIVVGAGMVIK